MKVHITIMLLFAALNFAHALPACPEDLAVQPFSDTVAWIDPTDPTTTLIINGSAALSTSILTRDPEPGICFINIGLVEHFPRGGTTGCRRASIFVGALKDNRDDDIWWQWDSGESGYPNGRHTERRVDNYTIRIYDLIRRGDSLAFKWVHPDENHPEQEWVDFDFNNQEWNDRDTDCSQGHCCRTGPFYDDGENRKLRGIGCSFRSITEEVDKAEVLVADAIKALWSHSRHPRVN